MKKTIVILLSFCWMFITLSSCMNNSNGAHDVMYVSDNIPYFESINFVLGDEYLNNDEYEYCQVIPVLYDEESVYIEVCLDNNLYLERYDYSGVLKSQINLNSLSSGQNYDMNIQLFGDNNQIYLIVTENDYESIHSKNTLFYLDENEDFILINQIEIPNGADIIGFSKACVVNGKIVASYQYLENSVFYDGVAVIDTRGELLYYSNVEGNIRQINGVNDDITISVMDNYGQSFYRFNMSDYSCSKINFDEEINNTFQYGNIGSDGNIYIQNGTHILKLNLNTREVTEFMDYNYCDGGLYTLSNGYIDYIDNDKIILLDLRSVRNEAIGRCKITVLMRADTNPYSGKYIIDVAELWGIDEVLSEGVKQYNETNPEFFAYVNDKYDVNVVEIPQMYSDIVSSEDLTTAINYITNSLMQDIRNGLGPDVVIGLGDVTQTNSDTYLKDLNVFIDGDNGINREDYFANAFSAFSTWGKQYQLPLSLQIYGIMTNTNNAPSNGIGYTYDEYISLINDSCNGMDVLGRAGLGRNDIFANIFATMQNEFISEECIININNDSFIELATYSRDIFSESGDYQYQPSSVMLVQFYDIFYDMVYGYASYQNWDVYGIPSNSGKGPVVTNFNTVAITTCTINENESWSFVKCLLCEEVQVSQMLENPININAFEQFAEEAIAAANEVRLAQDESARILDYSDIIRYEEMLLKADSSSFADTQILLIMNEELQAFYHGDKSIDEVIAIIEDRCQTILDERK